MGDAETNRLLRVIVGLLMLLIFIIITGGFGLFLLFLFAIIYGFYLIIKFSDQGAKAISQGVKEGLKKSEENPPSWWKNSEKGIRSYIIIAGSIIILMIILALLYKGT